MIHALARAGVLPPGRLAEVERLRTGFPSDETLADELARREWLTPLQARWLARGLVPVIGPYVLLRRLGRGGQADVHMARHRHLRRVVALKTLRGRSHAARGRFFRECEALGRLDHPNVVHAYDAGEYHGIPWVALEYIPGPDLERLAVGGPLDAERACEYARQAALGLAHLHDRGLVHRDVKPSNLALGADGRVVKVLDVGLARPCYASPDGEPNRTGVLVGTPDYVAPEQVCDFRQAGPKADQYALGATLYRLLTGRVPFPDGPPVARSLRRLTEAPVPVDELRPDLPAGLGAVVGRLLARRPRDRFASMAEVVTALSPVTSPASDTVVAMSALSDTSVGLALPDEMTVCYTQ